MNDNTKVILVGDNRILQSESAHHVNGEKMLEFSFNHSLTKTVEDYTKVTRTTQGVLDLTFVSDNIYGYDVSVVDGLSDHKMIFLLYKL